MGSPGGAGCGGVLVDEVRQSLSLALPSAAAWRTLWSGSLDGRSRCFCLAGAGFVATPMVMVGGAATAERDRSVIGAPATC